MSFNMKRKKIVLMFLVVIIAFILGVVLSPQIRNQIIIIKGYAKFGNKYCEGKHSSYSGPVTTIVIHWTCPICGEDVMEGNGGPHPKICYQCSELTGRCNDCGRLEK